MEFENLTEIIYEPLSNEFGWGRYDKYRILIRRADSFANATMLCSDNSASYYEWSILESTQNIIKEIRKAYGKYPARCQFHANKTIQGVYVHPAFIPHIILWIYPEFAVTMSKYINSGVTGASCLPIEDIKDKLDSTAKMVKQVSDGIETILSRLEANSTETYVIYFCKEEEDCVTYLQYYDVSTELPEHLLKLKKQYPQVRELVKIESVPDAKKLAVEFSWRIKDRLISMDRAQQTFVLPRRFDEQRLAVLARAIFEEGRR